LIAFYISGHGFGHASRQIEIINALARRMPDVRVFIRSSAARRLFDRTVDASFELDDRPCDTGVVQIDSLRLDAAETIRRASDFYRTLDARADAEAALLRERDVRFVIADAPPLACAAAARAGIPSIVVSNFTWDWIYEEYAEYLASAPDLIRTIQGAYGEAQAAWRLPMHGGFETFTDIQDLPFVARHARHAPEETRKRLNLAIDRRIALSSFGGYGVDGIDFAQVDTGQDWTIVTTQDPDGPERAAGGSERPAVHSRICTIDEPALYAGGLRYEDLVAAVDLVITKPGYGIISECIANDTAIVYTDRGRFAEYPVLVREMPKYLRCAFLDQDELRAGRWKAALDAAAGAPGPGVRPATNGAEVIADMIGRTWSA